MSFLSTVGFSEDIQNQLYVMNHLLWLIQHLPMNQQSKYSIN